jgi:antitoxin component of MazEF toxin-antitoxin module
MKHTVILIEDPETGDLVMPFPEGMCDELGWEIGDTLQWNVQEDGTIILTKTDQEK